MNYFSSLRLKKDKYAIDIIWSKMKLALETEFQSNVQVNVLLNYCKQKIMSLSLLVGTTVQIANANLYCTNGFLLLV